MITILGGYNMEEFLALIKARHSTRAYANQPVAKEDIVKVLEAGRWAPSAFNKQPWKFLVVESEEGRKRLLQAITGDVEETKKRFAGFTGQVAPYLQGVPVFIVVVTDPQMKASLPAHRQGVCADKLYYTSASFPVQNMMLMAEALGLSTVCFTPASDDWAQAYYREALGFAAPQEALYILPLGYAAQGAGERSEELRLGLEQIVCWK